MADSAYPEHGPSMIPLTQGRRSQFIRYQSWTAPTPSAEVAVERFILSTVVCCKTLTGSALFLLKLHGPSKDLKLQPGRRYTMLLQTPTIAFFTNAWPRAQRRMDNKKIHCFLCTNFPDPSPNKTPNVADFSTPYKNTWETFAAWTLYTHMYTAQIYIYIYICTCIYEHYEFGTVFWLKVEQVCASADVW